MADNTPKDDTFFRKVVRFVANPATDWADLNSRQDDGGALDLEKSELKAMIERKKRNDFVRKREFDMLRKVRREGLSPEQLAALGGSSRIDSESKNESNAARVADSGVKAKIDEIEQQMVGDGLAGTTSARRSLDEASGRSAGYRDTTTRPAILPRSAANAAPNTSPAAAAGQADRPAAAPAAAATPPQRAAGAPALVRPAAPTAPVAPISPSAKAPAALSAAAPAARTAAPAAPSPALAKTAKPAEAVAVSLGGLQGGDPMGSPFTVEVAEVVHDPELDEAVIAFANADFEQCEQSLTTLTRPGGARAQHAETWLVLFDLHRATGQQHKFEGLALEYAQQFGWSAPQWFSLPRLVAESAAQDKPRAQRAATEIGWLCPATLDSEAVAKLRSTTLQLPLPWVLDWSALRSVEPEAAAQLSELLRHWAGDPLEMRWLSGEHLLAVLSDAAPTGVKDADPAFWVLRLDALRLANRPDQFDEVAIDYCVTYEVSPPSWERAKCQVRIGGSGLTTQSPPLSQVSDVATSFVESGHDEHTSQIQVATVELSGQMVGDISATLKQLDDQLHAAALVTVNCQKLIRVDFVAAGDLLNWVMAKRSENRSVTFADAHRLVALFFGAMGINENASVRIRNL